MQSQRVARVLEFFLIGVVMGITEDIIVVAIITDATITIRTIGLIVLVAVPFAVLSELVVDHPAFDYFERAVEHVLAAD